MILADRAMKARRNGACPLCRSPIWRGSRIVRLGQSWTHSVCAIAWQKDRGPPGPTSREDGRTTANREDNTPDA